MDWISLPSKDLLQKYQDASLKRKAELREQIKAEQQAKQQVELTYRTEIQSQSEQMKKDQDKVRGNFSLFSNQSNLCRSTNWKRHLLDRKNRFKVNKRN